MNENVMGELRGRVAALSNENAELKVLLMDTLVALGNSEPRPGAEGMFNNVVNRVIGVLGLSDEEVNQLLG
jgi:hypothetical protein